MITIEHLCRQYESVNSALCNMRTVLLQFTYTSEVDEIMSHFVRSAKEISKLYFLANNLANQQNTLIHKNSLLKQQRSSLEAKDCIPNIDENLRFDCDYTKDIQLLYRQIEIVLSAVVDMTIAINISTLYLIDNEISAHISIISRELPSLFFMIGNFVNQQSYLTQEHDSLRKRLTDLEQSRYNNRNIQASSPPITRESENPLLDFDSPEAKQIFSGLIVPPLLLSSAAHSSNYASQSAPNLYSTSLIQLEANEGNYRKEPKHIENEQKQLKRTRRHYNLLSLI